MRTVVEADSLDFVGEQITEQEVGCVRPENICTSRRWPQWMNEAADIIVSAFSVGLGLGDDLVSVLASQIRPSKIKWLWPNHIPIGKLTLFVGNPDNGKSLVSTHVAASVSTGSPWYGSHEIMDPSEVLMFACEDDPEDTTVPRLMAAEADLAKIRLARSISEKANGEQREMQLDKDIDTIQQMLTNNKQIRLVLIDPVSNYLGATKMTDEQAVRKVLTPLQKLAADTGVAIIGIMHLNKKEELNVISRIGGAMAFVGVARTVWAFAADPERQGEFHMLRVKNNIADRQGGLKYRITTRDVLIEGEPIPQPYVEWIGNSETSAEDLFAKKPVGRPADAIEDAVAWLEQFLGAGPRPSSEVETEAKANGHSSRTLQRAKEELKIKSQKEGDHWNWSL